MGCCSPPRRRRRRRCARRRFASGEEAEALRAADSGKRKREAGEEDGERFVAHVPLPDEREIQSAVLQKKKADLMAKYASSELTAQEAEAKAMLNKQ